MFATRIFQSRLARNIRTKIEFLATKSSFVVVVLIQSLGTGSNHVEQQLPEDCKLQGKVWMYIVTELLFSC